METGAGRTHSVYLAAVLLTWLPALQIKPAVLRNYARYMWVLMKPGFSSAEEQWTSGEAVAESC